MRHVKVVSPELQEALQAQARIAIETSVQNGFKNLIDFLENEYLPNVRPGMDNLLGVFIVQKSQKMFQKLQSPPCLILANNFTNNVSSFTRRPT